MRKGPHMRLLLLIALAVGLLAPRPAAAARTSGAADFDTTCAPCRDFDQFANGGWKKRTKLPAGYSNYGAFDELYDRNEAALRAILETAASQPAKPGSNTAKLRDYYASCMDSTGAERAGGQPIAGLLADIRALGSNNDIARKLGWLHANGIGGLFGFFAAQDPKHSENVIAVVSQGGLGLPDRDFYLRTDSASVARRAVYLRSATNLLKLAGDDDATAAKHADAVMALETALANASMTNVQRRDPKAVYHKMPWDSLQAMSPAFAWKDYLASRNAKPSDVNVTQPDFVRAVNGLLGSTPLDTWKAYLKIRVLFDAAPTLSSAYVQEWFALRQALTGTTELLPRWKRCIAETDDALGEILSAEYVKKAFTPADKQRMLTMVTNLEEALGNRIQAAPWMSDTTRTAAAGKLGAFMEKIGYPDRWKDYGSVTIVRGQHYANRAATRAFEAARNMAKIGKPVDRGEWSMTPPTVNAYYSSSLNSINFPAGILQPPFFDSQADDATNYGAIGAVIGHEMGHGFDDRGRQFDAKGNLSDWWQPGDVERYKALAQKVQQQFDGYTVLDTVHVNGKLTLGENLADLGGLAVAYAAMQKAYAKQSRAKIDGFTPEQRFFLGWARVWRNLQTDADLRTQVQTDPHSPAQWRINGPMSNLREFHDAWDCKNGDAMVRPEDLRVRIW
ncbi:MAG: M13 family metallopeptidase [Candidatus Eisenbacteria bacterium]